MLFASRLGAYTTGEITPSSLMGVVYQAEDTKLQRTILLKFLATHMLNEQEP